MKNQGPPGNNPPGSDSGSHGKKKNRKNKKSDADTLLKNEIDNCNDSHIHTNESEPIDNT